MTTPLPDVTPDQLRLLERAASNTLAACEALAPMIGLDAWTMYQAVLRHGMRAVLRAAKLLP